MGKGECKVEEMLGTLYERNEQYRDTKERVVWLAGVIYFTFSLFVLRWIPEYKKVWAQNEWLIMVTTTFLTLLFFITFRFIRRQTWEKCKSVKRTDNFHDLIKKLDDANYRTHEALINQTKYRKGQANFFRDGWSGVLILAGVLIFYAAQITFLCNEIHDTVLLLYGFWIALFLFLLFLLIRYCLEGLFSLRELI